MFEQISERFLTTQRPDGGAITAVEIIQGDDGKWHMLVNVSWIPRTTHIVAQFTNYQVKFYKKLSNAQRHIIGSYGYVGPIIVRPKVIESFEDFI